MSATKCLKGLIQAFNLEILLMILPATLLGAILYEPNILNFLLIAMPIIILCDVGANLLNNYSDWEIDKVNHKRSAMHGIFIKKDILVIYLVVLILTLALLFVTNANMYVWIFTGAFVLLGILYSVGPNLKDIVFLNYLSIGLAYGGLTIAIGFFSNSASLPEFMKFLPLAIFFILINFGFSITKDYSDIKGDKLHNKKTLPVLLEKKTTVKVQLVIVTAIFAYLLCLIGLGMLGLSFLILLVCYLIALYVITTVSKTDNVEVHKKMRGYIIRNTLLAIVICIILVLIK